MKNKYLSHRQLVLPTAAVISTGPMHARNASLVMVLVKGGAGDCAAYMAIVDRYESVTQEMLEWVSKHGNKMHEREAAVFMKLPDDLVYRA